MQCIVDKAYLFEEVEEDADDPMLLMVAGMNQWYQKEVLLVERCCRIHRDPSQVSRTREQQ